MGQFQDLVAFITRKDAFAASATLLNILLSTGFGLGALLQRNWATIPAPDSDACETTNFGDGDELRVGIFKMESRLMATSAGWDTYATTCESLEWEMECDARNTVRAAVVTFTMVSGLLVSVILLMGLQNFTLSMEVKTFWQRQILVCLLLSIQALSGIIAVSYWADALPAKAEVGQAFSEFVVAVVFSVFGCASSFVWFRHTKHKWGRFVATKRDKNKKGGPDQSSFNSFELPKEQESGDSMDMSSLNMSSDVFYNYNNSADVYYNADSLDDEAMKKNFLSKSAVQKIVYRRYMTVIAIGLLAGILGLSSVANNSWAISEEPSGNAETLLCDVEIGLWEWKATCGSGIGLSGRTNCGSVTLGGTDTGLGELVAITCSDRDLTRASMMMAIAFGTATQMFSLMQVCNCAFNFTPLVAFATCLLQTTCGLTGVMIWFDALFDFNDTFNTLCVTPDPNIIHLAYGISWQLALTAFYLSYVNALIISDAVNWQMLLPSMGYKSSKKSSQMIERLEQSQKMIEEGGVVPELRPSFERLDSNRDRGVYMPPRASGNDNRASFQGTSGNESQTFDNRASFQRTSQSSMGVVIGSAASMGPVPGQRRSSINPFTGEIEDDGNDQAQAQAMALIEAAREETIDSKVQTVMASGFSREEAKAALMLVSTASEAIRCLQDPNRLEPMQNHPSFDGMKLSR